MGGKGIPLDKAELLSTILEAILYGFSLLMFGATIWIHVSRRHIHQVNRKILVIACLLLLFSTVHLVIDTIRIMEGLILYRDNPGGPIAFFSDVSQWTFTSKNFVYVIQSLIGDGVILYRCYMVWQSKLVMILPMLLWFGTGVAGFGAAANTTYEIFFVAIVPWVQAFYALTFSTNMLTTVLLAYRIWDLDSKAARLRGHSRSPLRQILYIVVNAGVLYNITIIAVWICFALESNGQFVILDMIVPIISIAFYMVILRVGLLPHEYTLNACRGTRTGMQIRVSTLTERKCDDYCRTGSAMLALPERQRDSLCPHTGGSSFLHLQSDDGHSIP